MKRLIDFVIRHPLPVILLVLLLTVFFIFQVKNLETEEDMGKMFPEDHPVSIYTARVNQLFGDKPKTIIIALYNEKGIFNRETLKKIDRITEKLKELDNVIEKDVLSLTSIDNISGTPEGIRVEPLIKDINNLDPDRVKEEALSNELLAGSLVSTDGTATMIQASFEDDTDSNVLYGKVNEIIQGEENPEKIYLAGTPIGDYYMTFYMEKDMMKLFPMVLIVIILILILSFKSFRGVIIPFLTVIFSIMWTMGTMSLVGVPLSMMSMLIPIILLPIGCADAVHILRRYYTESRESKDKDKDIIVSRTMKELAMPVVMTSITTMAGFASLATTPLPWIKYFGLFTAVGSFSALLISLTFIPACLRILKIPGERKRKKVKLNPLGMGKLRMEKLGAFAFNYRKSIIVVTVVIVAASIAGVTNIKIKHHPLSFIPDYSEISQATRFINEKFQGVSLLNVIVESEEENGLKNPTLLKKILALQDFAESIKIDGKTVVGGSLSIADYIKRINLVINENKPEFLGIPAQKNVISDYILLYSISGDPDTLYKLIDFECRMANVQLILKTDDSTVVNEILEKLNAFIPGNFAGEGVTVQLAGNALKTAATMELIVSSQVEGLLVAVLVILLLCMLEFRSVIGGFLCISDVSITILINYGILGILDIPLTMPIVIMSSLVLGIGVDFTIHFIDRYKKNIQAQTEAGNAINLEEITKNTTVFTGIPIFITAVSLFLGFSVLVLSTFPPIAILGILVAFTMFSGFFGTIITLSSLLNIIKPKFIRRNT